MVSLRLPRASFLRVSSLWKPRCSQKIRFLELGGASGQGTDLDGRKPISPPEKHTEWGRGLLGWEKSPGGKFPRGPITDEQERAPSVGEQALGHERRGKGKHLPFLEPFCHLLLSLCFQKWNVLKPPTNTHRHYFFIWNNLKEHRVLCTSPLGLIFNMRTRWSPGLPCAWLELGRGRWQSQHHLAVVAKMRSDKKEKDLWWKLPANLPSGWGWQWHSSGPRQGILRSNYGSLPGLTSREWTSSPHSAFFWHMLFSIQSGVRMLPSRDSVQVVMLFSWRDVTPWEACARIPYLHVCANATCGPTWSHQTAEGPPSTSTRQAVILWAAGCLPSVVLCGPQSRYAPVSVTRLKAPSEWRSLYLHAWHRMGVQQIFLN